MKKTKLKNFFKNTLDCYNIITYTNNILTKEEELRWKKTLLK